ncbi:helix-turn-helix transcriptional regulator [Sphingobacterium sp. KU25419]|nr:helix-turn-helix transcriptional regulator [Sphingobacterium sp. KU25419]
MISSCLTAIDSQLIYLDDYIQKFLGAQGSIANIFTPREIELLKYFADGESISKTAERTFLSPHTIIAHRRKMMAKAHCNSIGQLIKFARDHELI